MVSKSQIKLITGLAQKKNRTKYGLFIVEGIKGISEFLNSHLELDTLFTTQQIFRAPSAKTQEITEAELKKLSALTTPQTALAIFKILGPTAPSFSGLTLALDGIRDPGNLGTIIRLCDWFGIEDLVCSPDTVDCYNPKVVQASMGSITRVNISYMPLHTLISSVGGVPVLGTFLEGENVYTTKIPSNGIMIMGNEANGISEDVEKMLTRKINIPQFGNSSKTESLNVATATAVLLSEFRRQENY
ncbi:RNA methyltransferase [Antarcticibacterium arcticum]|uniref:RNA methyltransferase n=1 Tax=Antarcticibacterium arcticum TaxID=2585771 RepID=A0A5B8YEA1_9FLAO|nr:RNA methyltransferase [Antarcticibacterium arcticum]QED36220.1 RNA methyltransferase [Antarcticibacterium arcticum]